MSKPLPPSYNEDGTVNELFSNVNLTDMTKQTPTYYGDHDHLLVDQPDDSGHKVVKCSLCGLGILISK